MDVRIYPSNPAGQVRIPPSKSMAHRAILCAALADGESVVGNIDYSQDIQATIRLMEAFGAEIQREGDTLRIRGTSGLRDIGDLTLDCGESGSTLRFLIPLFSLGAGERRFTGRGRLLLRPQTVYENIFHSQGILFEHEEAFIRVGGGLRPGAFALRGDVSSQFISGLLFALPLLDADSTLLITPPFESRSYVELSIQLMSRFGVRAFFEDEYTIFIPGRQRYKSADYQVEGDYSQLAFFAVLGALRGEVRATGMSGDSLQGDRVILPLLRNAGARVEGLDDGCLVAREELRGIKIDLADCPDLGLILFTLGAFASGTTHIINAGRLRMKESDRIAAMDMELRKAGAKILSGADEVWITGQSALRGGAVFHCHNDHRVAMSLAVAASAMEEPCILRGAGAVSKSYPSFFEDLAKAGVEVEYL